MRYCRLPLKQEVPARCFSEDERKPQKVEGLRFAEPAPLVIDRREATKLNQAGLVRMERQHELLKPCTHRIEETTSVALVLEADHHVIGIAHDDHVASGLALSPALGPQVQNVMQVDIAEERRNHRALARSPFIVGHNPVFQHAPPPPFLTHPPYPPFSNP